MDNSDRTTQSEAARDTGDGARAAALAQRVAALEKVVAIERRLRHLQAAALRAPAPAPASDDATVLYSPPAAIDDDATVLHRPPAAAAPVPLVHPVLLEQLVLAAGFRLHEYRIDAVLGQGGFGVTYLATDIHLNARVAIKEYLPGEYARRASDKSVSPRWPELRGAYQDGLDSFLVEARTLATFRHPNIVRVARFFEANRTAYMVLEYERGQSLKQWWSGRAGVAEAELLGLLQPLLDGLAVVHAEGFLHRDVKPDNIYVRKDDGSLVLLDFGAARQAAGPASAAADALTPGYAPPEQYARGAQGPWTDIYALGATLYWMISGAKPPPAPARASGAAVMASARAVGHGRYSDAFLGAVDWALEIDPAARPQHLQAWSHKLFGAHAGSLALRDALRAGDPEAAIAHDNVRALRNSPRRLWRRVVLFGRALLRPSCWPMAAKMAVAMVLTALLPMLITASYNLKGSVAAVSASELRNLERLAQSSAGRVAQLVGDSEHLANFLAAEDDLAELLRQPSEAHKQAMAAQLAMLVKTNPDVQQMFVTDAAGLALAASTVGVAGHDFAQRADVRAALQGRPLRTAFAVDGGDGTRGMVYAQPVVNADRKVTGVVVLRVRASTIGAILDEVAANTGRVAFMIDGDGILVHHPDAAQLHNSLDALAPATEQRIAAERRFGKPRIDSLRMPVLARALVGATRTGNISYFSTVSGVDEHAGYAPVKGHDWVVGISESRSSFEAPLQTLFANVLYSVVLVGLLFLVLALLFTRSIVRPIARLTDAANALKDGDYDRASITVTSGDEIGRLARTFNVMIDVLRQREREQRRRRPGSHAEPRGDREDG
ncbi:MAG: cache domain-containing protein [Pseudomonadota bacterium]|nr:cache domain-containing protein [Pseudomonadota bacterium]